ncbi:MAG TPA: glycerate kinase [Candidatus Sulfotelmatobacter sp.]|nr:glycerate kinase [Candidatus Sulfotelmatobacter sp.]
MIRIKNKDYLINNRAPGNTRKARTIALNSLEYVLNAVDAAKLLKSKVKISNNQLYAEPYCFDLGKYQHLYVIGGGKAAASMAVALEEILADRITRGLVNIPNGTKLKTNKIELHEASHPIPDESGVTGTRRMMEIIENTSEDDLVIVLISGGGSSLIPLPRNISLQDKRELTDKLLKSGARIDEINAVRKHLSYVKGGWLAKKACPATILNLIISDVVGDSLESIASGPTVPDSTTFADAHRILERYDLWKSAPPSIRRLICDGEKGIIPETPKADDVCFEKVHSLILGNCRFAAIAAIEFLKSEGLNTLLLTSSLEGEAKTVGRIMSSIAAEVDLSGNPIHKPAAIVLSGETVVTVRGKGRGGRNQELALSAAPKLKNSSVVIASLSTDGVDGPTDAAGAIVDGKTLDCADHLKLDPDDFLADNDSYSFFSKLGDLIFTGPTGTNVNDISLIIIL